MSREPVEMIVKTNMARYISLSRRCCVHTALRRMNILEDQSINSRNIIKGDQNQVDAFSLEYFSNLSRSAWAYENACGSFSLNRPALAP